ncbi:MAG TPA: hypothetical protein VEX41_03155, partial [Candidatus Eisenbacteria bacterium]|nr:hypothetical protein [Candidatus Eisenbacteria bacterium]
HRSRPRGAVVDLRRFGSATEFMAAAGAFLGAREAEHNLIFGICAGLEAEGPPPAQSPPRTSRTSRSSSIAGMWSAPPSEHRRAIS